MIKFLIKRIISLIPVFILITIALFTFTKVMPGDPVQLMIGVTGGSGPAAEENYKRQYELWQKKLKLDRPIVEQYFSWVVGIMKGGENFGYSTSNNGMAVADVVREPLKNSIILNFFSIILAFAISIPVGIKSAVKRFSFYDSFWQVSSLIFMSMPVFFIGLCLIYFFVITIPTGLPFGGIPGTDDLQGGVLSDMWAWIKYLTLPVVTLTIGSLAGTIRYVRNAMLEVIKKDYIRTARAKGLSEKVVIYSHAFRNALIPIVTIVSGSVVGLFGGSAITETIFTYNGIGNILVAAVSARDYALILTLNLFYAVLGLLANIIMDISYALVDPRVKLS